MSKVCKSSLQHGLSASPSEMLLLVNSLGLLQLNVLLPNPRSHPRKKAVQLHRQDSNRHLGEEKGASCTFVPSVLYVSLIWTEYQGNDSQKIPGNSPELF